MINSRDKSPPSRPIAPVIVRMPPPTVNVEVNPESPDVIVTPQITVQPAQVILPKGSGHPKLWDIEVVERDELGLIKRVVARAIES
jgi:hypothetical protein